MPLLFQRHTALLCVHVQNARWRQRAAGVTMAATPGSAHAWKVVPLVHALTSATPHVSGTLCTVHVSMWTPIRF